MTTNNSQLTTKLVTLWILLLVVGCWLLVSEAPSALAQEATEYELLEPLPFVVEQGSVTTNAQNYIAGAVKLIIALAGVMAVVMIIFGGIKYMSTDAFTGKEEGKGIIQNALWGLALTMSAWIILYTVNPSLVTLNLSIERVGTTTPIDGRIGGDREDPEDTPPGTVATRGPSYGDLWGSDASIRTFLETRGVTVNRPNNCTYIGEEGCTSLTRLRGDIPGRLVALREACECEVIISGGTEYWLHGNKTTEEGNAGTYHVPGGRAVDLSLTSSLRQFVEENGSRIGGQYGVYCDAPGTAYRFRNVQYAGTYVIESGGTAPHFHVCY